MNPDYILLGGLKNPKRVSDYFASHLVDVAYAEVLPSGEVKVLVESDIDLRREEVANSTLDFVIDALRKNAEDEFTTEVVLASKA